MGECQDCTLWNESVEPTDEVSPAVRDSGAAGRGTSVDRLSVDLEGCEVTTVSCPGAVKERPASTRVIRFLVRFTGATRPEPSKVDGSCSCSGVSFDEDVVDVLGTGKSMSWLRLRACPIGADATALGACVLPDGGESVVV